MKRITTLFTALASIVAVTIVSLGTVQAAYLKVDIATPNEITRQKTFNVEFTALTTDANDNLTVKLYQNGSEIRSVITTKDYGDSGSFSISVPSDGTYQYYFTSTNGVDTATSTTKSVTVDATPSAPVSYGGTTRNGNTYTVTFTVPANSDVTQVRVFSSPSSNFTADASTQVGVISVTPGQTVSFNYTTPDGQQRFTAVEAFDSAGNGSTIAGDPNTNVVQTLGLANVARVAAAAGAVAGANAVENGEVNAGGGSSTGVTQSNGDVLGSEDQATQDNGSNKGSIIAYLIIAALIIAGLIYANRVRIANAFKKS